MKWVMNCLCPHVRGQELLYSSSRVRAWEGLFHWQFDNVWWVLVNTVQGASLSTPAASTCNPGGASVWS